MKDLTANIIPVNKTAAKVMQKGEHWESKAIHSQAEWETPPPTKPMPLYKRNFKNLIGMKSDRITIVGYLGGTKEGSLWSARCVCGKYVTRKQRTFLKSIIKKTQNCCQTCGKLDHFRKKR